MPTYQYRCTEGHQVEVVQSFTDDALRECPQCSAPVRKVYGSVGVVFKGSGFYRNDSRDTGSSTSKSSDAKSDVKSDTTAKPDTKSDSPKSEPKSSSTAGATSSTSGSSASSGSAA